MGKWRKTGIDMGKAERGVTLMELLIAIAVFSLLMTSIVALFVSSIRAARSGNLAMEAYEESRGAFDVVERDLMTAFTSRDYGDYYSFFGMPYGFMFVGLVRGQRASAGDANLARVTYVLRRMPDQPTFETTIRDSGGGDPIDVTVETCSLLRVVETGLEDLSSFNLGVDGGGVPTSWADLEGAAEWDIGIIRNDLDGRHDPTDPSKHTTPAQHSQMVEAVRRELWIRMLAGREVCQLYENTWQRATGAVNPAEPQLALDNPFLGYDKDRLPDIWNLLGLDPEDYVVADNILFRAYRAGDPTDVIETGLHIDDLNDMNDSPSYFFFSYGRQGVTLGLPMRLSPLWCAEMSACELDVGGNAVFYEPYDAQLGTPLVPHIPEVVRMRLTFLLESPYPGAPDFRRRLEQVIDIPAGYVRTKRNG